MEEKTKVVPSIAAATGVGAVHLGVTDGDVALRFYRDYVGLTPLPSSDEAIRMGAGNRELVVLHPGAERPVMPHTTGLYHLAILVPDRRELAKVVARLGALGWEQSPTDHLTTKANYLWDPDGNGIEVYAESPEDGTLGSKQAAALQVLDSSPNWPIVRTTDGGNFADNLRLRARYAHEGNIPDFRRLYELNCPIGTSAK